MTKPYCPSNGTEGAVFMGAFCDRCKAEAQYRATDHPSTACRIATAAMALSVGEAGFPPEWVQDDDGSNQRCTAFQLE